MANVLDLHQVVFQVRTQLWQPPHPDNDFLCKSLDVFGQTLYYIKRLNMPQELVRGKELPFADIHEQGKDVDEKVIVLLSELISEPKVYRADQVGLWLHSLYYRLKTLLRLLLHVAHKRNHVRAFLCPENHCFHRLAFTPFCKRFLKQLQQFKPVLLLHPY
jgi:hypothetical protein